MGRSRGFARRPGFTVVELLVVMAIIILLIGILLVGLNQAAGTAQKAQTRFLMNSMAAALAQFKADHGYLPPVLGDGSLFGGVGTPNDRAGWSRDVILPPVWSASPDNDEVRGRQNWYSVTSPAEYLVGYGDRTADGYGIIGGFNEAGPDDPGYIESPAVGIRAPGADGAWGTIFNPRNPGLRGTFFSRNPSNAAAANGASVDNTTLMRGRTYGPYLELKDENLLGGLRPDGTIARPEEPDYQDRPKVILDYWGTPIRYYRNPYTGGSPRAVARERIGLEDVFALRPWTIEQGVLVDGLGDDMSGDGNYGGSGDDSATTPQLKAGEFALLSAGPDRRITRDARVDVQEFNRDNIVEIGP